jgi:hypothetical protein
LEHIYIFAFFAVVVLIELLIELEFDVYGHSLSGPIEQAVWRVSLIFLFMLYALANIFYMSILSSIWSFTNNQTYECPILGHNVPLVVYVRNRRLLRQKNTKWHEEDKGKVRPRKSMFTYENLATIRVEEQPGEKGVRE